MATFRDYKNYNDSSLGIDNNHWTTNSSYSYGNKISPKGIFRTFGDYVKYGKLKKKVLR